MQTVVHVTHEAIQKIGGIGAVLQGLLTSKAYLSKAPSNCSTSVNRSATKSNTPSPAKSPGS